MTYQRTYGEGAPPAAAVREDDVRTDTRVVDDGVATTVARWSPLQLVGLVIGIGFVALGIAAVARTGFDTNHIYRPQAEVWNLPHSPLLGVIEIAFGAVLLLASIPRGGARSVIMLLGAISLAFGIVVLAESAPNRLNHWLGVDHSSGWLFAITGAVLVLAALLMPVFVMSRSSRSVRREPVRSY